MKKIWKLILLLLMLLPFTFTYKVKADEEILVVESIRQIENETDVDFMIINNYEVAAIYEDLGDTLEFEVKIKNVNNRKNAILKDLTILTENEGVDYSAEMDRDDLELEPNETRIIRVTGILNNKAINSEDIIKLQLHYTVSDRPCPDCDKPIPVIINPTTGDTINYSFIILGASIVGLILVGIFIITRKKKKGKKALLLLLPLLIIPNYTAKADADYVLEVIIHQKININRIVDTITAEEVSKVYDGDPIDGIFTSESGSPVTPIYYDDDQCQNPIEGKPVNAGIYYATATSAGNTWYKPGTLPCTKTVTIEKADITIKATDQTKVYDGEPLNADSTCDIVGEYDGYTSECVSTGSITNVGETDKVITSVIIKKDNIDITNNYNITPEPGILKVTSSPTATTGTCITPTYSGLAQELVSGGEFVTYTNNSGIGATDYTVTVTALPNYMFEEGEFTKTITCGINSREINIQPNTQDIIYGEELSSTVNDVVVTNLVDGHLLTSITLTKGDAIDPSSEAYEACVIQGEKLNSCYKINSANGIIDALGTDVTSNYDIKYKKGILRIHKKIDTITVNEVEETYTGDPIDGDFDNESDTPITPIYYDDDQCQNPINGKPTNVGIYYATATSDGNDIYKAAELQCTKVVTINKAPSTCPLITDISATYDEKGHTLDVGEGIVGGNLYYSLDGETWSDEPISVTNAGVYNILTKVVGDNNHNDQLCGTNTITINPKNISITATNQSKVYDGEPLIANNACTIETGYGEEYTVECVNSGSITNAGETDKVIESVVIKKNGVDVTSNYNITPINGKLSVTLSPNAEVGECSNPVYNGLEQTLINTGSNVTYQNNTGINAEEYTVIATADSNYSFEDGETMKVITCPVAKRSITITPKAQDIQFGEDISNQVTDVDVTNLVQGQELTSIVLLKDTSEVTTNGKINASNAIIKLNDVDTTSNYDITYEKGTVTIYYNSTFTAGEHCEATSPRTKKSYNNSLELNSITPKTGYSAKTWLVNNVSAGSPGETITIDGNYTYTSNCIDDIKPTLINLNVVPTQTDFTINVKTEDLGSGTTKIEWFYKKCADVSYTKLPDTDFNPTNEVVEESNSPNICLKYGTYYVYVKITDDAGNVQTSEEVKVDLLAPTTDKVEIDGSNVGTSCKTLECSLNELLQYFK